MPEDRFTLRAAVYLLLLDGQKVLMTRRKNTGFRDEEYCLVAGHLEGEESVITGMIREAKEEVGINLAVEDLSVVHILHRLEDVEYVDFFLFATRWEGEPRNLEPDKCDDVQWFPLNALPKNIVPHVTIAITQYQNHAYFSEYGFEGGDRER